MRLKQNKQVLKQVLPSVILCCMAFWVIYRFASGTTPLRPDEYCWDSAFFQVVGKLWAEGMCPYLDIFDHKGPLLFLIQKAAYLCSNPRIALYVLESSFVSASLLLCQRILRLKLNETCAFIGTVIMLVFWLPLMEYGNLCETYSMPFVLLALLFQLKYWNHADEEHPISYAFVYGLCFGANIMIRPNNGLMIAAVTLVITIQLACLGKWKNIYLNAISCGGGVLFAAIPFISYFAANEALDEFVYAVWTFNLTYAAHLSLVPDWNALRNVLFFITPALLSWIFGTACFLRKRIGLGWMNIVSASLLLYSTLSGALYAHYFMILVPLVPLAFYTAASLVEDGRKGWKGTVAIICAGFTILTLRTTISIATDTFLTAPTQTETRREQAFNQMVEDIEAQIPIEERCSVALCCLPVDDVEIVLNSEIRPVGRYCFLMEWHAQADPTILLQYQAFIESGEASWVLMRQDGIQSQELLLSVENYYEQHSSYVFEDVVYRLCKKRTTM